ncbi:MAG: thioredoxin domain-containing protein [Bacteroidota bacterium]
MKNRNRLSEETSPYLLQHATNPVDWYAWKPEAFEKAKAEDKPILVSIGYSTCHWCHVMERESFESEEIAAYMNEHFVNIKVDREERPDVDHIYMEACQALSGSGGWPLNCFLTPDGRPFYAGTYFPPKQAYNRPSWLQLLHNISKAYQTKRDVVEEQAERLLSHIRKADEALVRDAITDTSAETYFSTQYLQQLFKRAEERFDAEEGGFGGAPKFPGSMSIHYLLDYSVLNDSPAAREHALFSLDKMIMGGIYDQIGGGFARYATDREWLVPHFEKMLYDNALLVSVLSQAYKLTGFPRYEATIVETLDFIEREMTSPEGGIYSALDADSEGVEGKFYVWNKLEVEDVLGPQADWFCAFYDVTNDGNWEGHNILRRQAWLEDFAEVQGLDLAELRAALPGLKATLLEHRGQRIRPGLDDKILLPWNALQCSAYAHAFQALQKPEYGKRAVELAEFMLTKFRKEEEGLALLHTYKEGQAQYDAFLEDYALLIDALLAVYSINWDTQWIDKAAAYTDYVLDHFLDPEKRLFYVTSAEQKDIVMRRKDLYDSATPSGNSTMVGNLQQLGLLLDRADYRDLAVEMLLTMGKTMSRYPVSFARWVSCVLRQVHPPQEVAVVGPQAGALAQQINALFVPGMVVMASEEGNENYPLLAGKNGNSEPLIYVCRAYSCQRPVDTIDAFKAQLDTGI